MVIPVVQPVQLFLVSVVTFHMSLSVRFTHFIGANKKWGVIGETQCTIEGAFPGMGVKWLVGFYSGLLASELLAFSVQTKLVPSPCICNLNRSPLLHASQNTT